jgi:FkbM family methyltransferase
VRLRAVPGTLRLVMNHPLNRRQKGKALVRYIRWQIGSRLAPGSVAVDFVERSRLLVKPGMTGATGNIYTGLQEYEGMLFVLHSLRPGDRFVDVGANVGSYTVLASAVVGADCIAVEPVPATFSQLCDNVYLNRVQDRVQCLNLGVSNKAEILTLTSTLDTLNHVVTEKNAGLETITAQARSLDEIAEEFTPSLVKIDVEGFETEVIAGSTKILAQETLFAVILELNGAGERYGFDETALNNRMVQLGFKPHCYLPFDRELRQIPGINASSANTIYIRDIGLVAERVRNAPKFSVNGYKI